MAQYFEVRTVSLLGQFSPSVASWDPQNNNFSSPEKIIGVK
jgi:hypothetical protein